MGDPVGVEVRKFEVLSDPQNDIIGIAATAKAGDMYALSFSNKLMERLIIDLLQAFLDMPGRPTMPAPGAEWNGFRARAIHLVKGAEGTGAVLLDVGPLRIPLILDQGSMRALGEQMTLAAGPFPPVEGRG